jgi:hypothetical protein
MAYLVVEDFPTHSLFRTGCGLVVVSAVRYKLGLRFYASLGGTGRMPSRCGEIEIAARRLRAYYVKP